MRSEDGRRSTEADLEARIDAAIRRVLPWLPRNSISHQTRFSLQFGGKLVQVDGLERETVVSRADIILRSRDKYLAVLELKRDGLPLKEDDAKQGLSYARVLQPMPPLVIVTNGRETQFLETHSGEAWTPQEPSEEAFNSLVNAAADVARRDLKEAVSTLMGNNPEIWVQAIRQTSDCFVQELTGAWEEFLPFVEGFLIPRAATAKIIEQLRSGRRFIILAGPPLVGKSNVLRDLADRLRGRESMVVLFCQIEGSGSVSQHVADALARELDWPVTKEEARSWLKKLSHAEGPQLVIAIDGVGDDLAELRGELAELSSAEFGRNLAIVLELNESAAERAALDSSRRRPSAIGRRAQRISLQPLDEGEFNDACKAMEHHCLLMSHGAQDTPEYRLPWVLRALGAAADVPSEQTEPRLGRVIPSLLSLQLIELVRKQFHEETRLEFRAIAKAALDEAEDSKRPVGLILDSIGAFVVRYSTLRKHMDAEELNRLVGQGYLKRCIHQSDEDVLVALAPELVASETAAVLTEKISASSESADDWARRLSGYAANLPLGDVIAAQAIVDALVTHEDETASGVVVSLMNSPPEKKTMQVGQRMVAHHPVAGKIDFTIQEEGIAVKTPGGNERFIQLEPSEQEQVSYGNAHPWLILSHLAGVPSEITNQDRNESRRLDPNILLEVGACAHVLRRPHANPRFCRLLTYELPGHGTFISYQSGIVEPITLAIFHFLRREGRDAELWLKEAIEKKSICLLARIDIALRELTLIADPLLSDFAKETLVNAIEPAIGGFAPAGSTNPNP